MELTRRANYSSIIERMHRIRMYVMRLEDAAEAATIDNKTHLVQPQKQGEAISKQNAGCESLVVAPVEQKTWTDFSNYVTHNG